MNEVDKATGLTVALSHFPEIYGKGPFTVFSEFRMPGAGQLIGVQTLKGLMYFSAGWFSVCPPIQQKPREPRERKAVRVRGSGLCR